jgi:hypothetical protein
MRNLAAAPTLQARIVSTREDGSGGIVEVPIVAETPFMDFSKSEGGGPKKGEISQAMLQEMDANFARLGRPVTVGVDLPGVDHKRDKGGPAPGFMVATRLSGRVLWASIDAGPVLFMDLTFNRAFGGFSIEAAKDLKRPTGEIPGWVLTGGIFTNNPATDSNFRIAASAEETSAVEIRAHVEYVPPAGLDDGVKNMAEKETAPGGGEKQTVSLTFHESKLAEQSDVIAAKDAELERIKASVSGKDSQIAALTAERNDAQAALSAANDEKAAANATKNRLEAENKSLRGTRDALQISLTEKDQELTTARKENLSVKVTEIVTAAIDAGIAPATFGDWSNDPAAWMEANFVSVDALENQVAALKSVASGGKVPLKDIKSGHDPKTASDSGTEHTEEEKAVLSRFGGDEVDYTGVTTEKEAREREAAFAASKKE